MAPSSHRSNRLSSPFVTSETFSGTAASTDGRPTPSSSSSSTKAPADKGEGTAPKTSPKDDVDVDLDLDDVKARIRSVLRNDKTAHRDADAERDAWEDVASAAFESASRVLDRKIQLLYEGRDGTEEYRRCNDLYRRHISIAKNSSRHLGMLYGLDEKEELGAGSQTSHVAAADSSGEEGEATARTRFSKRKTATDKGKGTAAKECSKDTASAAFKRDVQAKSQSSSQDSESDDYDALSEGAEREYRRSLKISDSLLDKMLRLLEEDRVVWKEYRRCEAEWKRHSKILDCRKALLGLDGEACEAAMQYWSDDAGAASSDKESDAGSQSAASDADVEVIAEVAVGSRGEAVLCDVLRGFRAMDDPTNTRFTVEALLDAVQAADPGARLCEVLIGDLHGESEVVARATVGRRGDKALRRTLRKWRDPHFTVKQLFEAVQAADPGPRTIAVGVRGSRGFHHVPSRRPRGDNTYNKNGVSDHTASPSDFCGDADYAQFRDGQQARWYDYHKWATAWRGYPYDSRSRRDRRH